MKRPRFNPGARVLVGGDIEAKVTACVWDGCGWTYRVNYWHDGDYRGVELMDYELALAVKAS